METYHGNIGRSLGTKAIHIIGWQRERISVMRSSPLFFEHFGALFIIAPLGKSDKTL